MELSKSQADVAGSRE